MESGFLDEVREKFESKFQFSLLSNVILYRNDKKVTDLFANEIDYLFHYINNAEHHLVIIEVKNRGDMYGKTQSQPPEEGSPWNLIYKNQEKDIKEKNVKEQVRDQAEALKQFCENISQSTPVIEGWIIDTVRDRAPIISDTQFSKFQLKLLTIRGFEDRISQIQDAVMVEQSDFLRELRRGIVSPDVCHPEIPNAIKFIHTCRKSLDDRIYEFFKPASNKYAINGCAGMGKSVLLAYSIYIFASDHRVEHNNGNRKLINFEKDSRKIGLPIHSERKIYAFAVKKKQIEILEDYWEKIKNQIALINPNFQPHLQNPVFKQWQGEIPSDCNVLVIDESHDLSYIHQQQIAKWINYRNELDCRYLLVACDRNQALKRDDSEENVIAGVNFSRHSTRLNRIYRCPFPVYVASIGLMFRWFADDKGAKVLLSTERLREHFGFKPKIEEDDDAMILKMRSDCHPGNNWNQTVSIFKNCFMVLKHLSQFSFAKKDVLWVSFQKLDPDFDYNDIGFTWVDLRNDPDDEIDKSIKGQEFSIVVIEGLPSNMNPKVLNNEEYWKEIPSLAELEMWKCRRNLYVVCSRASAFLYFIADTTKVSSEDNIQELKNLIAQVSRPLREKHESGQTWRFKITNPNIRRKPLVFKDIDDTDDKKSEPLYANGIKDIEIDGNITVIDLSAALGISSEEFQRRLPDDSKAKNDIEKTVKLSHAKMVALQLGKNLKRIRKDSFTDIAAIEDKDISKQEHFNPKKVIDIENISRLSEALAVFSISKEEFLNSLSADANVDYKMTGKLKKKYLIEVAEKLDIEVKKTINKPRIKEVQSPISSPKRKKIREINASTSYSKDRISQDKLIDYVIKVLYEYGGYATKLVVEEKVYQMLKYTFQQPWYQDTVSNSVPRWKHDIAWAKQRAKDLHGFIKSPQESGRGWWELTASGKRHYQTNNLQKLF
jgi:hypothetical protein